MTVRRMGIFPSHPYPQLHLEVDGMSVFLMPDQQKRAILDAGYVDLGSEFKSQLPPVRFPVPGESRVEILRGYTDNAQVVRFLRDFLAAIN